MSLLAALLLLSSASDDFSTLSPEWQQGFRGLPDITIVERGGDSCLALSVNDTAPDNFFGTDEIVRSFPRPVLASERPFAKCYVWLQPFDEWPTQPLNSGSYNYAGFRLTIRRTAGDYVWPGIFISRGGNGLPALTVRVLQDRFVRPIAEEFWWTLAIRSGSTGALEFYAAPGRVALTYADLFFTDPDGFATVQSFDGWFLQVSAEAGQATSRQWFFGDVQLYADIRPTLELSYDSHASLNRVASDLVAQASGSRSIRLTIAGGYPAEPYAIERSTDLATWAPMTGTVDAIAESRQFYRLAP
jgi:hypothetical protein